MPLLYALGEDDFLDIRKAICDVVTGDWKEFGIALGFTPSVINGVSEANPSNPRGSLFDLLHKWVCKDFKYQQFGPPSWRTLVRAVAGGGRNFALAEKIAKMHPGKLMLPGQGILHYNVFFVQQ